MQEQIQKIFKWGGGEKVGGADKTDGERLVSIHAQVIQIFTHKKKHTTPPHIIFILLSINFFWGWGWVGVVVGRGGCFVFITSKNSKGGCNPRNPTLPPQWRFFTARC